MKKYSKAVILLAVLVLLNLGLNQFYKRFDLTQDQRYTLSETTKSILDNIEETAIVKIYLQGDFPSEFKRLQTETQQHLEELKALNNSIKFRFIDPLDQAEGLIEQGLQPSRLSVQEDGKVSEAVIFPWATIEYKDKKEHVNLLANQSADSQEEQLQGSIQNLEYAFADAFHKVSSDRKQSIAILKGNGELDDIFLASFLRKLSQYYRLAPFTLDSVATNPQETLQKLTAYDLAIIAKPTEKFTEQEKFTLDQYITNGGKSLWLIDNVVAELDSLMQNGQSLAFNRDLDITDLLFSYGVRLNYDLVKDMYSSTIRLAAGQVGSRTQFQDFLWQYHPVITSKNEHPITNNTDPVNLRFVNSIDTLKNGIKKSVLLQSSALSKPIGSPSLISLEEVSKKPIPQDYNNGNQILGVLLEGDFTSAYANRVKPFETGQFKTQSEANKMIIIADGDIIANQVHQGQPLELGLDKWTNLRYGNATFLLNAVNYLLDDSGLINLRSKTIKLQFLDKQRAYSERTKWQLINVVLPLLVLALFGLTFTFLRKRKYS
ncbi:MAG: gliding motility-associated ABC transporter substrate-binding protein GldG [Flavobacteriaceae bacterium]|nr:gliding motility-associated ABC transporter substrate-binding protein GldG [Flavobacteriaceae bacterium]